MSQENFKYPAGSDNTFAPSMIDNRPLTLEKIARNCLRMSTISCHQKVVNIYIFYTLNPQSRDLNADFTLGNCLFRAAELIKNTDPDKY